MTTSAATETRKGLIFALGAYGIWSLFPAYWKLMAEVPAPDVLAYRVVWTMALTALVVTAQGRWGEIWPLLYDRRKLLVLAASTLCIGSNWLVFIASVNSGHVLDSSMGYFLNPLVNVALGVMVLRERLRWLQWSAVGLATAGVLYMAISGGHPPWVPLFLAVTFSLYGLLRKRLPVSPLVGLAVETGLMLPVALVWLGWGLLAEGAPLMGGRWDLAAALAAGGPITALPLIWFAAAATRLRYSTLGFMQYMTPTGHFLLAVLVYGETPGPDRMLAFAGIWTAIALYSFDSWRFSRRGRLPV